MGKHRKTDYGLKKMTSFPGSFTWCVTWCVAVCAVSCGASNSTCSGWIGSVQAAGWCYAYIEEPSRWAEAEAVCKALGGYLAEIHNKQENDAVEKIVSQHDKIVWLGGHDLITEGKWAWASSSLTVDGTEFSDWATGEPNDDHHEEDCMEFYPNRKSGTGHWNDRRCGYEKNSLICQKRPDATVVV